jgi:hypothetical protein
MSASAGFGGIQTKLLSRYKDAYLVAKTIARIGDFVKQLAFILGIICVASLVLGIYALVQPTANTLEGALFIFAAGIGVIGSLVGFAVGVLVAAQGQILKAALDGSVNNSPFLENPQRVTIMGLD